jgi:hypothetical protein
MLLVIVAFAVKLTAMEPSAIPWTAGVLVAMR